MSEIQPKTDEEIERLRQEFEEVKMEWLKEQFKEIKAEHLRTKLEKTQNREMPEEIITAKKTSGILAKIIILNHGVRWSGIRVLGRLFHGQSQLICFSIYNILHLYTSAVLHSLSYLVLGLGAFSLSMGLKGLIR